MTQKPYKRNRQGLAMLPISSKNTITAPYRRQRPSKRTPAPTKKPAPMSRLIFRRGQAIYDLLVTQVKPPVLFNSLFNELPPDRPCRERKTNIRQLTAVNKSGNSDSSAIHRGTPSGTMNTSHAAAEPQLLQSLCRAQVAD